MGGISRNNNAYCSYFPENETEIVTEEDIRINIPGLFIPGFYYLSYKINKPMHVKTECA